jgi:signal transduction histidine kinase
MSHKRMRGLLFLAMFLVCALPMTAAFHLVDDALRSSLDLGFNPEVARALEISANNLKTLKTADPANASIYRGEFNQTQALMQIYARPEWVKGGILASLKIYFGCGLTAALVASLGLASLLARRISRSYEVNFADLLAQRDRVRYLEEMSSWQEMAKNLAHEIKNPLTPIEVLITSLETSYATRSPDEFRGLLRQTTCMVEEEVGHLKRTVDRYSDFARVPGAKLTEENPLEVIRRHLPALAARFTAAKVECVADPGVNVSRCRMDSALVRQILLNVIANGVEANLGRTVTFLMEVRTTAAMIWIDISNDGRPVRPDLIPRMFDPHVSAHSGRENMGLGLAIVKKIVIEHAGQIEYREAADRPSFLIGLPRVA